MCIRDRHYEGFQEDDKDDTIAVYHYVEHLKGLFINSTTADTYSFIKAASDSVQLRAARFFANNKESIDRTASTAIGVALGMMAVRLITRKNN